MPRTIIDIPDEQMAAIDQIRKARKVPRAALVREALAEYIAGRMPALGEEAFGIWRDQPVDSLAHERKLRREWPK
jgi:metal-responsive CopG/Arc/MetJ family transcriptional regulator